jgi:hypothetical protein
VFVIDEFLPWPDLVAFLNLCHTHFERVLLFTAVSEARVRPILEMLVAEGTATDVLPRL